MKTIHKHFSQLFIIVAILFTFSLSAWGQTTVEMKTFTATSAEMDKVISYSTAKGGGTSAPALNNGEIRLYQNSNGTGGGYITITAKENYTISSVTIGSSMATSVAHTIGSSTTKSSTSSLASNGKHTISDINNQSVTIYCMGTSSSSRLYINHLSVTYAPIGILEKHTITWMNGTKIYETTTYTEGDALTLPATVPTSCSDNYSTFIGWYSEQAGSTSNPSIELQGTEASKTDITGPTTFYAVFGDANGTSIPTESSIDFSAQGYDNGTTITSCEIGDATVSFSKGTGSTDPAYYTSGSAIRVYAKGNFTVSSYKTITSIKLTYGTSDKTNEITTDCGTFSNSTWIGSAKSVTFTIGGTKDHRRIKGITVTTESGPSSSAYISTCDGEEVIIPEAPTFNPAGGDFTETQSVEISAEDGASIYYTLNGDEPTTESIPYNGAIEISTTTTIKAIAVLDGVESAISEAEYRINIVDDIAAFISVKPTIETKISGEVVVTAISEKQDVIWIEDNFGAIMVYGVSNKSNYKVGDAFSGVKGSYEIYNGLPEIKNPIFPNEKTEGETPTPKMITISDITDTWLNKLIKIENVIYTNKVTNNNSITTRTFTDADDKTIDSYDSHFSAQDININDKVNLTAVVGKYNTNYQLYIISVERVKEPTISVSDSELDFGDVVENKELSKSTTITTVDLGESASVSISGKNASCFAVNTNTIEDNSETEITITFTAPEVDIETEYTATLEITGGEQIKEIALIASVYKAYTIKFGNTEKETNAEGKVTEIPTLDGVVGWTTNSVFAIVDEKPNVIDENTIFEENTKLYPVYTILEGDSQEEAWTLVTDASTLAIGDEVVVAAANYNYAMSTEQRSNNRGSVEIAKSDNVITINDNVQTLTLEAGTQNGTFAFNTGSGYLYAASSESNHLKTQASIKANGSWSIEISNKIATIKAQENSRNWMRFNNSNDPKIFSCYASGQTDIALYKKTGGAITKYNIAGNKTVDNNTTFDVENNININTLTIKSNFDEAGEVNVTAGALNANNIVIEKTIDASRWFFFSLPFDCNVADIVATGANGDTLTYAPNETDGDYVIAKYNGGWEELLGDNKPTLNANQGYIIGHFGSGDVTVKFPSAEAQDISAPKNATLTKTSDNGFNLIGLPYYQKVTNAGLNVAHVSIPNVSNPNEYGTYTQEVYAEIIASIAPFTSFFVQTDAENIEFTLGTQQNAAPRLDGRSNRASLHKAVVTLTDANGGADKTTIINNPSKTTDYEIGHDLTKLIGYASIPQIYSLQGDEMLAFNSLAIDNSTVIPLGVYAHADGEYTFALNEKSMGDLQGWELYDNETGKTTRLANEDLTLYLEQGTHEGRFEIRLQQRITTNCDNAMGDMMTWTANGTLNIDNMPADAVVYIYDAVGRMIYVATPNANTFNYSFVARGVYNIVVRSADNTVSFKTIY